MNIRLIIPETHRDSQSSTDCNAIVSTNVRGYLRTIASIAGGYTAYRGHGGWIDDNGKLVEEPVTIVDCNISQFTRAYSDIAYAFRTLAKTIARELSQDCVFLSIDGKAEFIKP